MLIRQFSTFVRRKQVFVRGARTLATATHSPAQDTEVLVDDDGCFVAYYPNFLSHQQQTALFVELRDNLPWKVETDDFGEQSRKSYFMADEGCTFKYVGLSLSPNMWQNGVNEVRAVANTIGSHAGLGKELVTACLINNYEDGTSFIPWHFDEVRGACVCGFMFCLLNHCPLYRQLMAKQSW
jgi:hypothetical protein